MTYTNKEYKHEYKSAIRVGDFVKVKDYGQCYDTYHIAFLYFWGNSESYRLRGRLNDKELYTAHNRLWKVEQLAFHSSPFITDLLAYVKDRNGNKMVISVKGLKLFKTYHKKSYETVELEHINDIFS